MELGEEVERECEEDFQASRSDWLGVDDSTTLLRNANDDDRSLELFYRHLEQS